MIAIVNYGSGNLFSLGCSLKKLDLKAEITDDKDKIYAADKLILPGVGAFGDAVEKLEEKGLVGAVKAFADSGKPLLGICLGMQLLFEKSCEYGEHRGLGLLKGEVCPLAPDVGPLRIPHMGWNGLHITRGCALFRYIKENDYVYFVHSFHAKNCKESLVATADYGVQITAAVAQNNVYGTQFHPEKSGAVGLNILKAFGEL